MVGSSGLGMCRCEECWLSVDTSDPSVGNIHSVCSIRCREEPGIAGESSAAHRTGSTLTDPCVSARSVTETFYDDLDSARWYLRLAVPLLRLEQRRLSSRYLRALLPARTA